ncbi:MAG: hypothetical protein M3619_27430, partial [Myxococcota bacterium]|nr:hypothetical protein [Myxococcota bacterium]
MEPADQTMRALVSAGSRSVDEAFVPIAQLGAGPDGTVVLARRGERLVELHQLTFGPRSPRWAGLAIRIKAISAVDQPTVRPVLAFDPEPPMVVTEGDSFPPLAELIEQTAVELPRAVRILVELGRGLAAAHHVGVF